MKRIGFVQVCYTGAEALAGGQIGAGIFSALGSVSKGTGANNTASINAGLLDDQAETEQDLGNLVRQRDLRTGRIQMGRTFTGFAQAGVDPTQGSPLDALSQEAKESEFKAESDQFQHQEKAWQLSMSAYIQRLTGQSALTAGYGAGAGQLLGGLAQGANTLGLFDAGSAAAATGESVGGAMTAASALENALPLIALA